MDSHSKSNFIVKASLKIVQHADDCTSILYKFLENRIGNNKRFKKCCRPKLNLQKTQSLLTGSFIEKYSGESYIHGVKITKPCIKSLGI